MPDNDSVSGRDIKDIPTIWVQIEKAHGEDGMVRKAAQEVVLARYRPAVLRYLRACLGDPEKADEVLQRFNLKFIQGAFRNADPVKGRFRDLLKTAIYNLIQDYRREMGRKHPNLPPDAPEPVQEESPIIEPDDGFAKAWRNELLNRCWDGLASEERMSNRPMHTVLRCRAAHPELRSNQLAEILGKQMGKTVTADWVRKWLHLAREQFAAILLREVAATLRDPTPDGVEEELIALELHSYCKEAVEAWRKGESK